MTQPQTCGDFRPISITPILSRTLEKMVTRKFMYPVLNHPSVHNQFEDQFAFRPTGSTTSALIHLTHRISEILNIHPYVHLIAIDFSKAFDTVRHSALTTKLAAFPLPDEIYNWTVDFLDGRSHCTKYNEEVSVFVEINSSFVQGSGFGPILYVLNGSDLHPAHPENSLDKYADDIDLLVPSAYSHTVPSEINNLNAWATDNNLVMNVAKCREMIIRRPRLALDDPAIPPPQPGLPRVRELKILGVTFTDTLDFAPHFSTTLSQATSSQYALRILRAHGLLGSQLYDVTRATLVSKLLYASSAWWGFANAETRKRFQSVLDRCCRLGFLPSDSATFETLVLDQCSALFNNIENNSYHVLHQLLPPIRSIPYDLRPRSSQRSIPMSNDRMRKTFICWQLLLDSKYI